jgi:dephospho-CoA kinase
VIIVGLTGSIASGKSTAAEMFKELGAYLIDWDLLAREVARPHRKAWQGIIEYFGQDVLNDDLTLNRQRLGDIVFNDPEKLAKLNQIIHPAVIEEDARRTEEISRIQSEAIIVKDIPLLVEIGYQKSVDKVVVVYASEENQLKRMMERGFGPEEARKRIRAQMPIQEKIKCADFVIQGNGPLEATRKQVEKIFDALGHLRRGGKK